MKKKIMLFIIMIIFLVLPNVNSKALSTQEILSRNECPNIELANAREDGGLDKIECYDDYNVAVQAMYNSSNIGAVLVEHGVIINAKYGVVDYDNDYPKNHPRHYVEVFNTNSLSVERVNYIEPNGGDEAVLIDYDHNTKMAKIKVSGIVGWIKKYDDTNLKMYDVIPYTWTKTLVTYTVTDTELLHNLPGNIYNTKGTYSIPLDIKPEFLNVGTYYSYDGHYFYNDFKTMLDDYRNDNYNNAINRDNPYFNYYQYLSFRAKSGYNVDNLNQYIDARTSANSKLRGIGEALMYVQENYGVNAGLILGVGINESGAGTSGYAMERNNLFGLNAVDSNPGEASYYPTVGDCILDYGYRWLSYWYLQPGDGHYRGANLGNKKEGLNVKYASDPYWGEKAASNYYKLDKYFDFQDRNTYQVAVLNSDYSNVVHALKNINGERIEQYSSGKYYQYTSYGQSIIVLEEINVDNNIWYKIQPDPVLDDNLNYIGDSKSNPRINYNFSKYAYVPAAYFIKISNPGNIPSSTIPSDGVKPISNIVNESSLKYESGFISGVNVNTTTDSLISIITSKGGLNVSITDRNGTPKTGNLATGDKINITSGERTETLEIAVSGDTDGDASISAMDYVNVKNHIMEQHSLGGAYLKAADVDKDSNITAMDYVRIKNYIMSQ